MTATDDAAQGHAPNSDGSPAGKVATDALHVRYHECDMQGIAFNATYLAWADMAAWGFFDAAYGSYDRFLDAGYEVVVVTANATFSHPARFRDELQTAVVVSSVGNSSFDLTTTIYCGDVCIAEIVVRYVAVERTSLQTKPLPHELRAPLFEFMAK
jgi:acyl-CoA thioester hydrolase